MWVAFAKLELTLLYGFSGLAAAYKLSRHGLNVTIFEAEGRAGGKLRSVSQDGLIWDEGANTMVCSLKSSFISSFSTCEVNFYGF